MARSLSALSRCACARCRLVGQRRVYFGHDRMCARQSIPVEPSNVGRDFAEIVAELMISAAEAAKDGVGKGFRVESDVRERYDLVHAPVIEKNCDSARQCASQVCRQLETFDLPAAFAAEWSRD